MPDEPMVFEIIVANNGLVDGHFEFAVDDKSNTRGLTHRMGGASVGAFGGLEGAASAIFEVHRGPKGYVFPALDIGFGAAFMTGIGAAIVGLISFLRF